MRMVKRSKPIGEGSGFDNWNSFKMDDHFKEDQNKKYMVYLVLSEYNGGPLVNPCVVLGCPLKASPTVIQSYPGHHQGSSGMAYITVQPIKRFCYKIYNFVITHVKNNKHMNLIINNFTNTFS